MVRLKEFFCISNPPIRFKTPSDQNSTEQQPKSRTSMNDTNRTIFTGDGCDVHIFRDGSFFQMSNGGGGGVDEKYKSNNEIQYLVDTL